MKTDKGLNSFVSSFRFRPKEKLLKGLRAGLMDTALAGCRILVQNLYSTSQLCIRPRPPSFVVSGSTAFWLVSLAYIHLDCDVIEGLVWSVFLSPRNVFKGSLLKGAIHQVKHCIGSCSNKGIT